MVKFTAPQNSRSIRATSFATRRRSLPMTLTKFSTDRLVPVIYGAERLSWIADKRRDVVDLRVESHRDPGQTSFPPADLQTKVHFLKV